MNIRNYLKYIGIGLIFFLSVAIYIGIYERTIPNQGAPTAKQGVLDLSGWDFRHQGLVGLDGEWEFYPGKLLAPEDFFKGTHKDASYLSVPGTWKGKNADGGMNRKGFGTYRLKVFLPDSEEIFGLKTRNIRMAHRLYLDGSIAGESGVPATDIDTHTPGNTPYSVVFHTNNHEIEIVVQVANYMFYNGGIVNSIQFGLPEDITKENSILLGTDIAFIIILAVMSAYHLSFYFMRLQEKSYFFSGMYLVTLFVYQSVYGEKILLRLLPAIPFTIAYKLQDVTLFLSSILLIMYFCSIDTKVMSQTRMIQFISPILLYMVAILVLPYSVYTEVKGTLLIYAQLIYLYILGRIIYLSSKNQGELSNGKELLLFIGSGVSLTIYLIDGILYAVNLVPTDLAGKIGVLYFIIFMNILMAVRFSHAYEKTKTLSHQLTISNQLKDEFLTNTSHEIKTPLHGILNITSYLLDDEEKTLSAKQKQNLWLIKDTSIKLSMLIHDLIDVTRLKHGELRLNLTVVDVKMVTQIVFDVLQFELLGKSVRLDNQVAPQVLVLADENRFRQIMYNLVHNAIKHTDKGTIKVMASVVGSTVSISVEDTGVGIAKEKHTAIFEYFEQYDQPLPKDGFTGMGVGLYISRKLVEQMNGDIRVEWSEPGIGTCMTFALPRAEQTSAHHEIASTTIEQKRVFGDSVQLDILDQHEHTIMIVDDEASNIHTLLNILKRHRYNVITAFSAKEAMVKMIEHTEVDLVILDVMMPEISGIELCKKLRSHYSILDLPILFATVKDTPHDIALGYRAGANDYVTKPFDAETLIARIQTLIAMKTSIQEAIRNEHAFHQAQIKPHFLYNALSSVISFCYTDGEKAAYLLSMLSQYLRYILDMDRHTLFVPLYRELELIHAYVEIEKARFGERFDFICYVDDSVQNKEIPSLCVQPFVENAIRHGLFEKEGQGKVTLSIVEGDRYLKVMIEDDGVGISDDLLYQLTKGEQQRGGIGIQNIRKRLDNIPDATLTISSEMGYGTKITMYLPVPYDGQADFDEERRGKFV
ncbi:hybrid sensor histidine kinase/response regulator [Brevibacillus sp. SYSU BS000544]|uniref:hybrid sensor histidine kinase/response regulator n=1 Tax=Brevibacillus sp. SYSU BS000544 TaxID=3416443 RepID=UPI003CE50D0E